MIEPPRPVELPPGRYRHYKGREYEVLYLAYHSESLEPMVVYRALYSDPNFPLGVWVRPLNMFIENVEVGGASVPRFAQIDSN